jgi:predicted adenylyl cyclase CyaB
MPRNIELKARAADPRRQQEIASALSDVAPEVLCQEDVFFAVSRGRLKLRILDAGIGELIYYEREDRPDPKPSDYLVAPVGDPLALRRLLERALGLRGVVRKIRTLYRSGRTRIHLDEVEGLGSFLELEVVVRSEEGPEDCLREARSLASSLGIRGEDLLDRAYIDLIELAAGDPPSPTGR